MSEGSGRAQMERRLIEKSLEDESFRRRLIDDPKAAVEGELGTRLPEEVRVDRGKKKVRQRRRSTPLTMRLGVRVRPHIT
jgi:hypothetical protein